MRLRSHLTLVIAGTVLCAQAVSLFWIESAQAWGRSHHLSEVGLRLGGLSKSEYADLQQKWVGTAAPACNFFVITALCEDSECPAVYPDPLASQFGTYLSSMGWKEVDLGTMEELFLEGADFDVIMQSEGTRETEHGHVLIPVSLGDNHQLTVAQGELYLITNEVVVEDDRTLMNFDGGMHIWISQ